MFYPCVDPELTTEEETPQHSHSTQCGPVDEEAPSPVEEDPLPTADQEMIAFHLEDVLATAVRQDEMEEAFFQTIRDYNELSENPVDYNAWAMEENNAMAVELAMAEAWSQELLHQENQRNPWRHLSRPGLPMAFASATVAASASTGPSPCPAMPKTSMPRASTPTGRDDRATGWKNKACWLLHAYQTSDWPQSLDLCRTYQVELSQSTPPPNTGPNPTWRQKMEWFVQAYMAHDWNRCDSLSEWMLGCLYVKRFFLTKNHCTIFLQTTNYVNCTDHPS